MKNIHKKSIKMCEKPIEKILMAAFFQRERGRGIAWGLREK
jgi:hypothetical protein